MPCVGVGVIAGVVVFGCGVVVDGVGVGVDFVDVVAVRVVVMCVVSGIDVGVVVDVGGGGVVGVRSASGVVECNVFVVVVGVDCDDVAVGGCVVDGGVVGSVGVGVGVGGGVGGDGDVICGSVVGVVVVDVVVVVCGCLVSVLV